jgi:hypothetical protein
MLVVFVLCSSSCSSLVILGFFGLFVGLFGGCFCKGFVFRDLWTLITSFANCKAPPDNL